MADSPEVRRKVARELIEKEIIVREAKKNNLIDESLYQQRLKRDYGRILRRRYLEATIKDTIKIPDEKQLKKLLFEKNKSVKVKQIFTKTQSEIEEISKRLAQGDNFEDIAKQSYRDASMVLSDGTVGWITWENVDINVEKVLFNLEVNQISEPVKSLVGWHIFKVDSISTVIQFNTDTDHYRITNLGHKILNKKLEVAAAKHIKDLVWTKKLEINARLFKKVWAYIEPKLPDSKQELMLKAYNELELSIPPDNLGDEIIARVDDKDFTVNDFLFAIPDLPHDLLRPNLRWAIELAVRDKIITEEAIESGFSSDPVVQEKYNRAELSYKYYAAMIAADSIQQHKVNLKSYYESYKEEYVDFIESEIEHIVVADRSTAIKIAREIYNGETFESLGKKYNKSVKSPMVVLSNDGPLGKKAAELSVGDIFAPVKTGSGYHVIRVSNQKKHYLPYEKVKTTLAKAAQTNYYKELHRGLLPSGYDKHEIEYDDVNLSIAFTNESKTIF